MGGEGRRAAGRRVARLYSHHPPTTPRSRLPRLVDAAVPDVDVDRSLGRLLLLQGGLQVGVFQGLGNPGVLGDAVHRDALGRVHLKDPVQQVPGVVGQGPNIEGEEGGLRPPAANLLHPQVQLGVGEVQARLGRVVEREGAQQGDAQEHARRPHVRAAGGWAGPGEGRARAGRAAAGRRQPRPSPPTNTTHLACGRRRLPGGLGPPPCCAESLVTCTRACRGAKMRAPGGGRGGC